MHLRLVLRSLAVSFAVLAIASMPLRAQAAAPGCGQAQVEKLLGAAPPPGPSAHYIYSRREVSPFYQWENNDGYCGEVSLISSGLVNGQWMGQYNARLICGAFYGPESALGEPGLLQAGTVVRTVTNYNAQLLIETPGSSVAGDYDFAHAALCGANSRLTTLTYPYETGYKSPNEGLSGYRDYMRWIKAQVIAGNQVTVGVLWNSGDDAQYDHEVSVLRIGTNHGREDDSYYDDDVLYLEDHGNFTLKSKNGKWSFAWNPSVPYGAGDDAEFCTPYVFAYRFDALPNTRAGANAPGAAGYSIVIPRSGAIMTQAGNDGHNGNAWVNVSGPHNYAFAVAGPMDQDGFLKPVDLTILGTRSLQDGVWRENPKDVQSIPAAGYNYESPYIGGPVGTCDQLQCISNVEPPAMLMALQATVSDLQVGHAYNLYEYDFDALSGADTGEAAALAVPTGAFNRNHAAATSVTSFKATAATFRLILHDVPSSRIVIFRAVPDEAP